jgi:hypothetical protein
MKEKFEAKLICTNKIHKFEKEGEIFVKHLREEKGVKVGEARIRSQNMNVNECIGCRSFEIRIERDGVELRGKIQPSGDNKVLILENEKGETKARLSIRE